MRKVRTISFIPNGTKFMWIKCIASAAARVVETNSLSAWLEFQMLPNAVLCAPLRKGNFHKKMIEKFIKDRCTRWLSGERMKLWLDIPDQSSFFQK